MLESIHFVFHVKFVHDGDLVAIIVSRVVKIVVIAFDTPIVIVIVIVIAIVIIIIIVIVSYKMCRWWWALGLLSVAPPIFTGDFFHFCVFHIYHFFIALRELHSYTL